MQTNSTHVQESMGKINSRIKLPETQIKMLLDILNKDS